MYKPITHMHVFDIRQTLELINKRALDSFTMTRLNIRHKEDWSSYSDFKNERELLIDEFIKNIINSFEFFYISGHNPSKNTMEELWWFNSSMDIKSNLYLTLDLNRVLLDSAGTFVKYHRRKNTLFLITEVGF